MPNMKFLSLTVQKLWPKVKVYFLSQRGQKLDAAEFYSGGIIQWILMLKSHIDKL